MVQPYLGQPNYMGAMSSGLSARLAYLNRRRGGRGGGVRAGGGNGMAPDREAGAPFSPERRAGYRNLMQEETARDVALEQAEAGVEETKAGTETGRQKTILDNAARYAAQVTQETAPDYLNWVSDSGDIPRDTFPSDEELGKMSGLEFNVWRSQMAAGSDYPKHMAKAKKATKDDFEMNMLNELQAEYIGVGLSEAQASKKALTDVEAIKKAGKHKPKSAVIQNFTDIKKGITDKARAKDYAKWTGAEAKDHATKIVKDAAGDSWMDMVPAQKSITVKKELDSKITAVSPDAKYGEQDGVYGWYAPNEAGEYELIQRWDD